ncbi:MAG: hypothetical protein Q7J27_00505 [Syntrophales bacterium]|nr:hypothetical protein [Syntrophales bacterium]
MYPLRAKIVDMCGLEYKVGKYLANTPEESKPHIGKEGLAEKIDGRVRITLDDGNVIYGDKCWWIMME